MASTPTAVVPTTSTKPPVTISSTAYLADGAYVRGTHPVTLGAHSLVHPRAYIYTIHAPVNIGAHTTIFPKATLGGPLLSTSSAEPPVPRPTLHLTPRTTPPQPKDQPESSPTIPSPSIAADTPSQPPPTPSNNNHPIRPVSISSNVLIQSHAHIQHSTTISSGATIESHATVLCGATIGAHSKICAGVTIARDAVVPDWTVVLGNGEMRRLRRPLATSAGVGNVSVRASGDESGKGEEERTTAEEGGENGGKAELVEARSVEGTAANYEIPDQHRLVGQVREREATMALLKNNARMSSQVKRQSQIAPSQSRDRERDGGGDGGVREREQQAR